MTTTALSSRKLKPLLHQCGYAGPLLQEQVPVEGGRTVPLVGFAHSPFDARSACIAVIEGNGDSRAAVTYYRHLGAPIVFVVRPDYLEWWKQGRHQPEQIQSVPAARVQGFFDKHAPEMEPEKVYRAKAWASVDHGYQLSFVDFGLIPVIEEEVGKDLTRLIERTVGLLAKRLAPAGKPSAQEGQWILRSAFWMVAAKILKDKQVPGFFTLDLMDVNRVFRQVADHYGERGSVILYSGPKEQALRDAAQNIKQFSYLGHVTTESLSYIYESALVEKEVRQKLGIHSTPPCLVDYIIGRLARWIQEIPADRRHVFEPACGHAAFLVAAMRLLRDHLPPALKASDQRKKYLRSHLHGIEKDPFALEIARLSLTLADIPNPNGWLLQCKDMFSGDILKTRAQKSMVLLANPPFENFGAKEKAECVRKQAPVTYVNKTAEMLGRTLPHMPEGSVFGVVVPQSMLQSQKAKPLRQYILSNYEIADICLFPKMFRFSDMESAVIIGRKLRARQERQATFYSSVREGDVARFREDRSVSWQTSIPIQRFAQCNWDMQVPDMPQIWEWCATFSRVTELADVGQGLSYKAASSLPGKAKTVERAPFTGSVPGYAFVGRDSMIHGSPQAVNMNLDLRVIAAPRWGADIGKPQVLLNYARVSRGPWRLKAFIDQGGHAVTSRFIVVRPKSSSVPLLYLWALLNSPLANAYTYTHLPRRDNVVGVLRQLPVPNASESQIRGVVLAASSYLETARTLGDTLSNGPGQCRLRELLLKLDAEVLRLYCLPARMERTMLDIFAEKQRAGVPMAFRRYYPDGFTPCFHLYEYLSENYQRSTAGELRKQTTPQASQAFLAALDNAMRDFKE